MDLTRRDTLLAFLFGAGGIGLRSLATGLPAAVLLNPRKALAQAACLAPTKAQYFILNTSGAGDPINANAPGTYADPKIVHSPGIPTATMMMRSQMVSAGQPWTTLPQSVLDRTQFWHLMTNTPIHPREPDVLSLMGVSPANEMLPSLLAKVTGPCLNTAQVQPVAFGTQPLRFDGEALPLIPPGALKDTLASPTSPLTRLQALRDQTMTSMYAFYKNGAAPEQRAYIDQMVTSQTQLRGLSDSLLNQLSSITDEGPAGQITAAVTLIQMNVAPVFTIHIPFGGDNHFDQNLALEASETISGVAYIASLMTQLAAVGLQDKVSFLSLNVFGRTLSNNGNLSALTGRNHNGNHQVSLAIGKPFLGGVIGGVGPVGSDYGATGIQSTTGAGAASGDILPSETLGAFAQTLLSAVGGDPTIIQTGKVVTAALA